MSENIEILNQIQTAVTELRDTDVANLKNRDVVLEQKMDTINAAITDLQKKSQRPTLNGAEVSPEETEHKHAWAKWARKGVGEHELEALQLKAVTLNNFDGNGNATPGLLMPKTVEAGIYTSLEQLSPIRSEATVIQVSSDDYRFLGSSGQFESGWVGEVSPRPETSTTTLAESRVPMGEIYANPHASQRALDDTAFDLDAYMVSETARAFALKENAAFIAGDGVNKPLGILSTSGLNSIKSGVAYSATTGVGMPTTGDAYIQMIYALPARFRTGAKFLMASASQGSVRLLKDANGAYIWQNSMVEGQPDKLNGYAIITAEEMPGLAANALPVVFGNLKAGYLIADRVGIRTLRDPYSKKPYVGFYSTKRVGGMVRDKDAFVALKVSA
jgi:HK97 family phage major capsid protein